MKKEKSKLNETFKPTEHSGAIMNASKRVLDHICTFGKVVDELRIVASRERHIHMRAVDPAHVFMRDLVIKDGEHLRTDADHVLGVDLDKLKEVARTVIDGDRISIGYKGFGNRLTLAYRHHYKELSTVDLMGLCKPKLPSLRFLGTYIVDVQMLHESLEQIGTLSNHCKFVVSSVEGFELEGESENDRYTGEFDGTCASCDSNSFSCQFSTDYLHEIVDILLGLKVDNVVIHLNEDYPMKLEVEEYDGDYRFSDVFLLAPRVSDE